MPHVEGCDGSSRAVVTLSLGARPFVQHTRPFMEAYAARIGAAFHFVSSPNDAALWSAPHDGATRFLKLPLLEHFLSKYSRVLYLDDDVLVGSATPDLFDAVPCSSLGATVERHKPKGWHAMHWRTACELYRVPSCDPEAWRLFNSGVMLLSRAAHAPLLSRWRMEKLQCQILCDQLYLNAILKRAGAPLHDLGAAFNYVGSEFRRAVTTTSSSRRSALRDACIFHLTRKVPKLYTADWVAHRSLGNEADVLTCARNLSEPREKLESVRRQILRRLPKLDTRKYDMGVEICKGEPMGCAMQPWARRHGYAR